MGCTNEKAAAPPKGATEAARFNAAGNAADSNTKPAVEAGKPAQQPAKPASGATEPQKPIQPLNAINAAKAEFKDIVEKEPFHSSYTLGDVLGRGNYSVVRKGFKIGATDGVVYAIKCIKESSLSNEDREALKIETAILKGMDCPHIIRLYGFYEEKKEKMFYIGTFV